MVRDVPTAKRVACAQGGLCASRGVDMFKIQGEEDQEATSETRPEYRDTRDEPSVNPDQA
jgi:hypothetical protein